ncbi:MAG: DUF6112 family protein [Actinomycetota bacterium]
MTKQSAVGRAEHWAAPPFHFSVQLSPTPTALPGSGALQTLANGLAGWALIGAMVGLVVGAGLWAVGAHAQNYQQANVGRRAVAASLGAALLVGAAPILVNFFFKTGSGIH